MGHWAENELIVGPAEAGGTSPVKDKNSGLVVWSIWVIVILLNDVDKYNDPVELNCGIDDHFVLVQAEPFQYRIRTPVLLPPSELAGGDIFWLPSTVMLVSSIAMLTTGTVINVLNLITSLFVVIGFS